MEKQSSPHVGVVLDLSHNLIMQRKAKANGFSDSSAPDASGMQAYKKRLFQEYLLCLAGDFKNVSSVIMYRMNIWEWLRVLRDEINRIAKVMPMFDESGWLCGEVQEDTDSS